VDPRKLAAASSGPGLVHLSLAEQAVGRITALEPASISSQSCIPSSLEAVTLDPVTTTIAPESATVVAEAFLSPDGWIPTSEELEETGEAPFS
jgi:hypothetical protein